MRNLEKTEICEQKVNNYFVIDWSLLISFDKYNLLVI